MKTTSRNFALLMLAAGLTLLVRVYPAAAEATNFNLQGTTIALEDVTTEVRAFFSSMRFDRAVGAWNFEVSLTNTGARQINGPFVLLVESYSGTTGPLQPDGFEELAPAKPYFDLTTNVPTGILAPGAGSLKRTLAFGFVSGLSPAVSNRVFALPQRAGFALAQTRTFDAVGQPLPGVTVEETGPLGTRTNMSEAVFGVVTLGQAAGNHKWKFTKSGYLPVWRQASLATGQVAVVPGPRLSQLATNSIAVSPIGGTILSNTSGSLRVTFAPGTITQTGVAVLTSLSSQTLPAFLPMGWSPLQAFWLDLASPPVMPISVSMSLWSPLAQGESAVLVSLNQTTLAWEVCQIVNGAASEFISVSIPGGGAYALVVPDPGPGAPPPALMGQALPAGSLPAADLATLTAGGVVDPASNPASFVAGEVTTSATVSFTNPPGPIASGAVFWSEIAESYQLKDGTRRQTPFYETFVAGYQRPGVALANTLQASFPLRPLLLFGPDELDQATVRVDVLPPQAFTGGVLDPAGGLLAGSGFFVLAGGGDVLDVEAVQMRRIETAAFDQFTANGMAVMSGFELTVAGVAPGRQLHLNVGGLPPTNNFVLARVLYDKGLYGVQPLERFRTDSPSRLTSTEPAIGDKLPGITSAGQFLLLRSDSLQALVSGVARNVAGQPAAGAPVQILGQPWLTFADADGHYSLLAPTGAVQVALTDLSTGDTGLANVNVIDPATPVSADVSTTPTAPRIVSINPTNGAAAVSRVTPIVVGFSEPVNPASLLAGGIQLLGSNSVPVPASLTLNLRGTIATLLPTDQLAPSSFFTILLSSNITDLTGLNLPGPTTSSFTTESDLLDRAAAQLIIYEPTNGLAPVFGTPGTAEPNSPVILANETSGQTATILSSADGSFTNFIAADVEDFISAVLVNHNGTRTRLPASRQIFEDGRVGLFHGGGILEAQSDGGPVQVLVEPGSIANKTTFKMDMLDATELLTLVSNTPPENGQLLGGFRLTTSGDNLSVSADVSFPISAAQLNLNPGESPTNRAFALCEPVQVNGNTVYSIVDRMHFENGKLVTHSPPFPGLGSTAAGTFLAVPIMMAFGTQLAIVGEVASVSQAAGPVSEDEIRQGVAVRSGQTFPINRLPGAVVSASPQTAVSLNTAALRPGAVVSRANSIGFYALLFPVNSLNPDAILVRAQHPRFPGAEARTVLLPPGAADFQAGAVANLIFPVPGNGAFADQNPPLVTVSLPGGLQVGVVQTVQFNLRDDTSTPTLQSVTIDYQGSTALLPNRALFSAEASLSVGSPHSTSPTSASVPVDFIVQTAAVVSVQAVVNDVAGNIATNNFFLRFGAPVPLGTNMVREADPNDIQGPTVVSVNPINGGIIGHGQLVLRFSEPVDQRVQTIPAAVSVSPPVEQLRLLSPNQQELSLQFVGLVPDTLYTVTLNPGIVQDLSGNLLDGSYSTTFRTPPAPVSTVPGLQNAVATLAVGGVNFTLDQTTSDGTLASQLPQGNGSAPIALGSLSLPPFPRTMAFVPDYSFKRSATNQVETKPLIVITGGLVGSDEIGQWLWVVDVSNPTNLQRIASELATVDFASTLSAIKWSPPRLGIVETRAEGSLIHHVNLQAFILGANGTVGTEYNGGHDANGDGDFVDPGDRLPTPVRDSLFGDEFTTAAPSGRILNDFSLAAGGSFEVGVIPALGTSSGFFQVFNWQGLPFDVENTTDGRAIFPIGSTTPQPRRVELDLSFPLSDVSNGVHAIPAAIVALDSAIVIYDLSNPVLPQPVRTNLLGSGALNIFSITRINDQQYAVGTAGGVFLLSRSAMGGTNALQDSLTESFPGLPMQGRAFAANDVFLSAAYGGAAHILVRAPQIRVVRVEPFPVMSADTLLSSNRDFRAGFVNAAEENSFLLPLPIAFCSEIISELNSNSTPNPFFNHYPLIRAHGNFGSEILVAAESADLAGDLNPPKGADFPAVILTEQATSLAFGNQHPAVHALKLKRLSDNPIDDLFNFYVGSPFLLVLHPLSSDQQTVVSQISGRFALWSGDFLRFSLDPTPNGAPTLSLYLSQANTSGYQPNLSRTYRGFRGEYLDSPNPSFPLAAPRVAGVDLQSGEFSHPETDLWIEGRYQDLVFTRVYQSRSRYVGPFGRGWDFNYNARLLELGEGDFPAGYALEMVDRGDRCDQAATGDLLFIDGAGTVMVFRQIHSGNTNLSAYATDPAIDQFLGSGGTNRISRFYESPPGIFTVLYKLTDSKYMMIMPNGSRVHFLPDGRLDRFVGMFEQSVVQCIYDDHAKLARVEGDRGLELEFGYYKRFPSSSFGLNDVASTSVTDLGKIAQILCSPSSANQSKVKYTYDSNGNLFKATPEQAAETIYNWSAQNPHELVSFGRVDGTQMPGQSISYANDLVTSITQNGDSFSFGGSARTSRDRFQTGPSAVSVSSSGGSASIQVDNRGRPTRFANRPFAADDQGRPTHVADVYSDAQIHYDDNSPFYRFRGNVLSTEEMPPAGGVFATGYKYDDSPWNRVIGVTNVDGDVTTYDYSQLSYDTGGELDESEGTITRRHLQNEYGQATQEFISDSSGGVTLQRSFSLGSGTLGPDGGLQTAESVPALTAATKSRDNLGRLQHVSQGTLSYTTEYNVDSQPRHIFDANGSLPEVTLTFNNGLVQSQTLASGGKSITLTYLYDPSQKSKVQTLTSAETGLPVSTTTYAYDAQGRLQHYTVDNEQNDLTPDGLLTSGLTGPGISRSVGYGAGGKPNSATDLGVTATYSYDQAGRLQALTQQGGTTTYTYDDQGSRLSRRFKRKVLRENATVLSSQTYTYDAAGRTKTETSQSGRVREFGYFGDGALRQLLVDGVIVRDVQRNSSGLVTDSRVNDFDFNFSNFDPDSGQAQTERLTLLPSSRALTQQLSYDSRGRLKTVTFSAISAIYAYSYDGFNNLASSQDPDGVALSTDHSPSGKLLSVTFPDSGAVVYHYNPQLRLDFISGGPGPLRYGYDSDGRVKHIDFPDGTTVDFLARNAFGQADRVVHGSLVQLHTWVDGRLTQISVPETSDTLTYGFDALGRRTSASLNGHQVAFGYDQNGELTGETNALVTGNVSWSASFDNLNHLQSEKYPSGLTLAFAPNAFGHPASLSAAGIQNIQWIGGGLLEQVTYSGGLAVLRDYDGALRNDQITYQIGLSPGVTPIAGYAYAFTPGGRLSSEQRLQDGTFDVYGRAPAGQAMRITNFLFSATNSSGGGAQAGLVGLQFSAFGELLNVVSNFGADLREFQPVLVEQNGRVTSADGSAIDYDDSGAVTNVPLWIKLPGSPSLTRVQASLVYDGLGLLRQVSREDGVLISYVRDGLGRIIHRTVIEVPGRSVGVTNDYFWQGNRLLEEQEVFGGNTTFRRYVYLGSYLVLVQVAPSQGGPFADFVPIVSLNGSVGGYLRTDGTLLETIVYSAYGTPIIQGGESERSAIANTLLFHGAYYDDATGLYQMGERNLHPQLGRFLQRDSELFLESAAMFTAFNGDPAGRVDPLGAASQESGFGQLASLGKTAKEFRDASKELYESGEKYEEALHASRMDLERKDEDLGFALGDLVIKGTKLAALASDEETQAQIKKATGQYDTFKKHFATGLSIAKSLGQLQNDRELLGGIKAAAFGNPRHGASGFKSFFEAGASVDGSTLQELNERFGKDRFYQRARNKPTALEREALIREATRDYIHKREGHLLSIGKGVHSLASAYLEKSLTGNESYEASVQRHLLAESGKMLELAEALRKAEEKHELGAIRLAFGGREAVKISELASKEGIAPVQAAFEFGFESGKLAIVLLSDPDVAKAYEGQVQQFEDNGGWLTAGSGVLFTIGLDRVAAKIQDYHDGAGLGQNLGLAYDQWKNYRQTLQRRTQYYLNGISAP